MANTSKAGEPLHEPSGGDPAGTEYFISTDQALLDVPSIHGFLKDSYWARNVPRQVVETSIRNSLCFGAYLDHEQAGFARVITDYATFGYVADVFVLPKHRGRGVSRQLMAALVSHPIVRELRRLLLITHDAHGLYSKFGFGPVANPGHLMTIRKANPYGTPGDIHLPREQTGNQA